VQGRKKKYSGNKREPKKSEVLGSTKQRRRYKVADLFCWQNSRLRQLAEAKKKRETESESQAGTIGKGTLEKDMDLAVNIFTNRRRIVIGLRKRRG